MKMMFITYLFTPVVNIKDQQSACCRICSVFVSVVLYL